LTSQDPTLIVGPFSSSNCVIYLRGLIEFIVYKQFCMLVSRLTYFVRVACDKKKIICQNFYFNVYKKRSTYLPSISLYVWYTVLYTSSSYRVANSFEKSRFLSDYLSTLDSVTQFFF